jgi:hypothetical protein
VPGGLPPGLTGQEQSKAGAGEREQTERGNGFATAALALGAAGASLVTIVPGVVFGVLGLRRAASRGSGRVRCWLGIGLCAFWTVAGVYLLPHLTRAADPGCAAYKGPALTAYDKVVADFDGTHLTPHIAADVARAAGALELAVARSRDPATAHALSVLARDLRTVLGKLHAGAVVPGPAMRALNRDAARADAACGTLHL